MPLLRIWRLWWRRGWLAMRRARMRFVFLAWAYVGRGGPTGWRFRQARDVVESEDRAEKRVVMCGAEKFAAASCARTRQPHGAARAERYDGDAVRRHVGFSGTGSSLSTCDLSASRPVPEDCEEAVRQARVRGKRWSVFSSVGFSLLQYGPRWEPPHSCGGGALQRSGTSAETLSRALALGLRNARG